MASTSSVEDLTSKPLKSAGMTVATDGAAASQDKPQDKKVISVFDVASSLETSLQKLLTKVDESDKLVQSKITKLSTRLDELEKKLNWPPEGSSV